MATEPDFKAVVKIEKRNRYKPIDENIQSEISEEQARELADKHFKQGIKESPSKSSYGYSPRAVHDGSKASAEILKANNWQWDWTEVTSIEFDEEVIQEIQNELPFVVAAIRAAIEV